MFVTSLSTKVDLCCVLFTHHPLLWFPSRKSPVPITTSIHLAQVGFTPVLSITVPRPHWLVQGWAFDPVRARETQWGFYWDHWTRDTRLPNELEQGRRWGWSCWQPSCHQEERAHLRSEPTQRGEPSNAEREAGLVVSLKLVGQAISEGSTTLGLCSSVSQ